MNRHFALAGMLGFTLVLVLGADYFQGLWALSVISLAVWLDWALSGGAVSEGTMKENHRRQFEKYAKEALALLASAW